MEMLVNDQAKIVEVWMTQLEKTDEALQAQLKPQYAAYKKKGYLVAVFLSGGKDLYQQTSDLLCYNRKRLAQQEVQKKKALRTAI